MKKFYFEPEIEIKKFRAENIVTGSGDVADAPITGVAAELPADAKSVSLSWDNIVF